MEAYLKKHGKGFAQHGIKVSWNKVNRHVTIHFEVTKRDKSEWLTESAFTSDWSKNWGLWNKDVVEAFLQMRATPDDLKAPYLEIQLSPLNQPFALIIVEPRKTFYAPKFLDFTTTSKIDGKIWKAQLQVELPQDLNGNLLFGGLFSCLSQDLREYYALEPNLEVNPDFHRPELFLPMDT